MEPAIETARGQSVWPVVKAVTLADALIEDSPTASSNSDISR